MQVFAKPGESLQQVGGECPAGFVEMQEQRPGPEHIATADGTWIAKPSMPAQSNLSCTRRQGLLALLTHGIKRADIEARIEAIKDETEREEAWIEYEAATWDSGNLRVHQMWEDLGGMPERLEDVFLLAVTL